MKHRFYKIGIGCLLLCLIVSCKSSRSIESVSKPEILSESDYFTAVIFNKPTFENFSSKLKLKLNLNGKPTTVNGSLKMKRDDVIQISIVPMLGIEVARIEITKECVLLIDRMNRQYALIPISELSIFGGTDLDFYTLQSLFYNEVFLPGRKTIDVNDYSNFNIKVNDDNVLIKSKKIKKLDFSFLAQVDNGLLTETQIKIGAKYHLDWQYNDFKIFEGKNFPRLINVSIKGAGKPLDAQLNLLKPTTDDNWASRTNVSKKYKRIDTEDLLKFLLNR